MTLWQYAYTQVLDYGILLCLYMGFWNFVLTLREEPDFFTVGLAALSFIIVYTAREQLYFYLLGDSVPQVKRDYSMSKLDWLYVVKNNLFVVLHATLSLSMGTYYFTPMTLDWSILTEILIPFWIIQVLKDVFGLIPFHELMHTHPYFMKLHAAHHTVGRNAQALMAFHIDFLDILLENMSGNILYLVGLWFLGMDAKIHIYAAFLGGIMDTLIHSINPYTVCLFNPILDYVFRCNVAHQVHHSALTANYTFIPFHHVLPGGFEHDLKYYNTILKSDWSYLPSLPALFGFAGTSIKTVVA